MADYNEGDVVRITGDNFVLTATLGPDGKLPSVPQGHELAWWEMSLLYGIETVTKAPPREPEGRYTVVKFNGYLPAIRDQSGLWRFVGSVTPHDARSWEALLAHVGGPDTEFEMMQWENI